MGGSVYGVQKLGRVLCDATAERFIAKLSYQTETKKPPHGWLGCLAETKGFEPLIQLITVYSLSRGAPSASRSRLR